MIIIMFLYDFYPGFIIYIAYLYIVNLTDR